MFSVVYDCINIYMYFSINIYFGINIYYRISIIYKINIYFRIVDGKVIFVVWLYYVSFCIVVEIVLCIV